MSVARVIVRPGLWAIVMSLLLSSCSSPQSDPRLHGSAVERLRPLTSPLAEPSTRRTVYVPVYSSIYWGVDTRETLVDLAATVSIRNVSSRYPVVIESVRYYDSNGKQIREYIEKPGELGPFASVEFVVQRDDKSGGPGANFLIRWAAASEADEPLIEAIMVGQNKCV